MEGGGKHLPPRVSSRAKSPGLIGLKNYDPVKFCRDLEKVNHPFSAEGYNLQCPNIRNLRFANN